VARDGSVPRAGLQRGRHRPAAAEARRDRAAVPGLPPDFIFPNLWQNWIAEKVRVGAAFVPVDAEHTLLYLRFYQKFLPGPLGKLVARLAMPANLRIAHQDRRVVQTQQPKPSGLAIGENLVQGDGPIAEYRRHRQALMDAVLTLCAVCR
jgi:hypothetical protein